MNCPKAYWLACVCLSMDCCAPLEVPDVASPNVPPPQFIQTQVFDTPCPVFKGVFKIIPELAVLKSGGSWNYREGTYASHALVIPLDRANVAQYEPERPATQISKDEILINALNPETRISFAFYNRIDEQAQILTLSTVRGDYKCESGTFQFPEAVISGYTEVGDVALRMHYSASLSKSGDFYGYEQIRGRKMLERYYLFKKIEN